MVAPRYRSGSRKRGQVRTPSGKTAVHYKKKKVGKHRCGRCGKALGGVPNFPRSEIRSLSRSKKTPERSYGGVLCANCLDELIRYSTRFEVKFKYPEYSNLELQRDLTLERFLPQNWFKELSKETES